MVWVVALLLGSTGASAAPSAQEVEVANLIRSNAGQQRSSMVEDPILSLVAQLKAKDMATRGYFAHVNPDGIGANALVTWYGYKLPASYDQSPTGNNIESLAAGQTTASAAVNSWLGSSSHRTHVLAEDAFFREQTSYGVGYANVPGSPYVHYWVFLSAPPNANPNGGGVGVGPFAGATNLGDGWYSNDMLGTFQLAADGRSAWIVNLNETVTYDGSSASFTSPNYGTVTPYGGQGFNSSAIGSFTTGDFGGWVLHSRRGYLIPQGGGWFWSNRFGGSVQAGDARLF